ncbi:MAG TPA: hypothetical protein VKT81_14305 [Bryobacteraceae bacterium]|nr:hypothetical protein [Bryobacteraceae bacterium]
MGKLAICTFAIFFLTQFLNAADISGVWSGTIEGENEGAAVSIPAHAELKQSGNSVTGKMWKEDGAVYPIEKGKIERDQIALEFTAPEGDPNSSYIHHIKLTRVSENRLEGTLEFEVEGTKVAAKLTLVRNK